MRSRILRSLLVLSVFGIPAFHSPIVFAQEAGPGEGLVVFTRASAMKGKAMRFNLEQDGRPIGQLLSGTTIEVPLTTGTYTFSVSAPSLDGRDTITINVEAGKTYLVTGEIRWGWPTGRPKFSDMTESGVATAGAEPVPQSSEVLAGAALGAAAPPQGTAGYVSRTPDEAGRIGLRNFVGDWDVATWSLASDGSKLEGHGIAQGVAEGTSVRITFTEFAAPAFPAATGGGQVRIAYEDGGGFMLESWFKHSNEVLKFSGRYEADTGRYVFYMFGGSGEIATGVPRSSTRVEIRSVDIATWVADTYSTIEGQSMQVQSYQFTRRSE